MPRETACHFEHALAQAQIYREQTQALLDRLNLPPTPVCYAVAYDYVARRTPNLRKDLDRELSRGRTPDLALINELFERFFLAEDNAGLESHLADVHRMLFNVLEEITQAGGGLADYQQVLGDQMEELKANPGLEDLRRIAHKLTRATEQTLRGNQRLRDSLAKTQQEADQLRRELVQAREEANTDGLTNLLNRKAFDTLLGQETEQALANGRPLSLLILDIDHFKRVNDRYGHPVGDEVIRRTAATVRRHIRGTDVAARFGGEEFAVLLPETDLFGALTVAGTMHRAIGALSLVLKSTQQRLPNISVSVGVGALHEEDSAEALLERVDQALYVAKRSGRNRVISERHLDDLDPSKSA